MIYIYPDTNIFMHCKHFEQIDWQSLAGAHKPYTVVVAMVVINELDKHKYSPFPRRAQKAKNLLPRLEALFEDPSLVSFNIINSSGRIAEGILDQYELDRTQMDDLILASILSDKLRYSKDDDVILFTNDSAPRIKARNAGIKAVKPNPADILPPEPDEQQKAIKNLQQEIMELKSRQPKIELTFTAGGQLLKIDKVDNIRPYQAMLQEKEAQWKIEFPKMPDVQPDGNTNAFSTGFFSVRQEQVDRYNKALDQYFVQLRENFRLQYESAAFRFNTFPIELTLANNGTLPAEDIDLYLHFPDGFELLRKKDLPKIPERPTPPHRPKNLMDIPIPQMAVPLLPLLHSNIITPEFNLTAPVIKKTNSYEVTYPLANLKHHESITLDPLYVHFDNIKKAKSFAVDYKITVGNLAKPVTGTLNVVIEI